MSFLSIESLITPVTSDDVFEFLCDVLESIDIPARSWRKGGVGRSILGAVAEAGAQGAAIVTDAIAGSFLLLGKSRFLTAHARDVYDVERIPATFATGQVTLTNNGGGLHEVGANELIVRASSTNARFRNLQPFILQPFSSLTIDVMAIEAGSKSSVSPGEIDDFETPLERVTVTNQAALVGRDEETDEELVRRCLAKRATWSQMGPRGAYEEAILSSTLPDGTPTSITRVAVSNTSSRGIVRCVCATPSGVPTEDELEAAREAVERKARPATVRVFVESAVPKPTSHQITIWCRGSGVSKDAVRERAELAMAEFISRYPIGGRSKTEGGQGYLFADAITGAVLGDLRYGPLKVDAFDLDFDGGPVDIPLEPNEVVTNTTTFDVRVVP